MHCESQEGEIYTIAIYMPKRLKRLQNKKSIHLERASTNMSKQELIYPCDLDNE